ncbi:hypothetical protein ABTK99_19410, partial [Acinetobacter baumannii]
PSAGDHHGCPFKHSEESHLRKLLNLRNIDKGAIEEIVTLANNHHYQVACTRVFAATHGGVLPEGVGNHPNAYFDQSVKYFKSLKAKKERGA